MNQNRSSAIPPTLNPERFTFWQSGEGHQLMVGVDQAKLPLPQVLLPINVADFEGGNPADTAIGQGVYDYLRQFPDCPNNKVFAELLQDAFPHFLTDLASQAVLLDAKDVDTAYVKRKLTGLKILALVDSSNKGLLLQLCSGFYDLAFDYTELGDARRHLLAAMRYGQEILKMSLEDPFALNLLAEIDIMFGDFPGADNKWQRALDNTEDQGFKGRITSRKQNFVGRPWLENNLIDDLESVHKAMELYAAESFQLSLAILDRVEEDGRFSSDLPSADYFYLLGMCRMKNGLSAVAAQSLERSLELDPQHKLSREALDTINDGASHDE